MRHSCPWLQSTIPPTLTRVARFTFVEVTYPEIQAETNAVDAERKAKVVAASKKGASYSLALQNAEAGVVTRFLPEPSLVPRSRYHLLENPLIM